MTFHLFLSLSLSVSFYLSVCCSQPTLSVRVRVWNMSIALTLFPRCLVWVCSEARNKNHQRSTIFSLDHIIIDDNFSFAFLCPDFENAIFDWLLHAYPAYYRVTFIFCVLTLIPSSSQRQHRSIRVFLFSQQHYSLQAKIVQTDALS